MEGNKRQVGTEEVALSHGHRFQGGRRYMGRHVERESGSSRVPVMMLW